MPGLTIACDPEGRAGLVGATAGALGGVLHFADYRADVLWQSSGVLVAATRYPAYPVTVVDAGPDLVVLEGRVYDRAPGAVADELRALARRLRATPHARDALLDAWIATVDGDFVLAVVDRARDGVLVVTDRYGRLPLYCGRRGDAALVTRELGVAVEALPARRLDREALAQFLLLGFPLGEATLLAGVTRLPPAARLLLPACERRTWLVHDFGIKDARDAGLASRLAESLVEAARRRAGAENLISLSGGIDSRIVALALRRAGAPLHAATHLDHRLLAARDAGIAETVARELDVPWQLVHLLPATGAEVERLLGLKWGANYLGMSLVLPYLDALRARYGAGLVYFTGDQGDRLLGDRTPLVSLADDAAVADYLIHREGILPPELVAQATGVSARRLRDAVVARLASYPERRAEHRHVHFLFYERAAKWMAEGEDRNRAWFWHATPFCATDVFEPAMRAPDAAKAHDVLRASVLAALRRDGAPAAAAVGMGGVRSARALRRRVERAGQAAALRLGGPRFERLLARGLRPARGYAPDSLHVRTIADQLERSAAVRDHLDPAAVRRILAGAARVRSEQFSVVLTVTALLERLAGDDTTLRALRAVPVL